MKKVLIATDGSDLAKKAAQHAVSLARTYGSEISFLTVVEMKQEIIYNDNGLVGPNYLEIRDDLIKQDTERSGKMLDKFVMSLDCEGIKTEKKVLVGDPHPLIVEFAKEGKFDLIVMGHRGLNPIQRLFIGSVAKRVIEDAPCSVLVVK
jgi:nucleotide-binding universal stress UspA family protein